MTWLLFDPTARDWCGNRVFDDAGQQILGVLERMLTTTGDISVRRMCLAHGRRSLTWDLLTADAYVAAHDAAMVLGPLLNLIRGFKFTRDGEEFV